MAEINVEKVEKMIKGNSCVLFNITLDSTEIENPEGLIYSILLNKKELLALGDKIRMVL